jgi:hypothetical protein
MREMLSQDSRKFPARHEVIDLCEKLGCYSAQVASILRDGCVPESPLTGLAMADVRKEKPWQRNDFSVAKAFRRIIAKDEKVPEPVTAVVPEPPIT